MPVLEETEPPPDENRISSAEEQKNQGNQHFREQRWRDALDSYQAGLDCLPKREKKQNSDNSDPYEDPEDSSTSSTGPPKPEDREEVSDPPPPSEADEKFGSIRAMLNANISACYVKMGDDKQAVQYCTEALLDDPRYIKVLQRRAAANERLASWSSLSSARDDYESLLKLLEPSSAEHRATERAQERLKPRLEAAQKRETAEMIDKLKGLGNSILGNFGLSTDNFKFVPNDAGGYSVNFQR